MKKLFILGAILLASSFALAAKHPNTNQLTFNLYASNKDNANIIATPSPTASMVKIYTDPRNDNWVKVGLRKTGQVGWLKRDQYRAVLANLNAPDIQTFYLSRSTTDTSGKQKINIVAYKNGKKVSDQQAQQLYREMRQQQNVENQKVQQFDNAVQNMLHAALQPMLPSVITTDPDNGI